MQHSDRGLFALIFYGEEEALGATSARALYSPAGGCMMLGTGVLPFEFEYV